MPWNYDLKTKDDIHWARKIWHFVGVMLILVLYLNVTRDQALQIASFLTFLFVGNDLLRHVIPNLNKVLLQVFGPFMREHEKAGLAGSTYMALGVTIIIFFFPKTVVTLALLFLAVADPLASYVGVRYGKDKIVGNKSLQGSASAFTACAIIAAIYFFTHNLMTERLLIVSLLSGLIGAVSELIPIGRLDDNLTFPLLSSVLLYLLMFVFGGA